MPKSLSFRPSVAAVAVLSAVALSLPVAAQPLSTAARRCVSAVDKGTAGLAQTQVSVELDCLKQAAAGKLGPLLTAEACIAADSKGRLEQRRLSVLIAEPQRCVAGQLPNIGVPFLGAPYLPAATPQAFDPVLNEMYAETTLVAVPKAGTLLLRDAFGDPLDSGLLLSATNAAGAACQKRLAKALTGCARAQRKAVLSCKKKSLAHGITSAAAIESACMETNGNAASGLPDPRGKLAKACTTAVDAVLSRYCAGQIPAAVSGACASAVDTSVCLVDRVDCRVCQETNSASGLTRDCDLLDDGLDNNSCG
ncbi:MAG: hypothetical protein ABI629_22645, partial [bacterium]